VGGEESETGVREGAGPAVLTEKCLRTAVIWLPRLAAMSSPGQASGWIGRTTEQVGDIRILGGGGGRSKRGGGQCFFFWLIVFRMRPI